MAALTGRNLSNRYRIDESLGRGGMADVYKAWDLQRATYLAIKVLRQDLAQDMIFLRRFQREAQTLEKLQHPNIVRFYGIERDDLQVFMLMEYIEGTTLQAEIFRSMGQPLNFDFIKHVMNALCSALYYAHGAGLVHCDLKPGNIMIDGSGKVLLTDFGIARMTDAATSTMVGFGTPAYMAPELVQGKDPTPQSDIYSLGVVLYEMMTGGERPFTGDKTSITGTVSDRVRWEQNFLAPPSPRTYNPNIPYGLEKLILQCLEKLPENRFRDTRALFKSLALALKPGSKDAGESESKNVEKPIIVFLKDSSDTVKEEDESQGEPPVPPIKTDESPIPLPGVNKRWVPVWLIWLGIGLVLIGLISGIVFATTSKELPPTEVYATNTLEATDDLTNMALDPTNTFSETTTQTLTKTQTKTPLTYTVTSTTTHTATNTATTSSTPTVGYTYIPLPTNTSTPKPKKTKTPEPSNTPVPTYTSTTEPYP